MARPRAFERLSARGLARLLERLDSDPDRAARAYETLRLTLVKLFGWRGARMPEECADETLDRLARKLDEASRIEDVNTFALGIARLVLLEQWRHGEARAVPAGEAHLERLVAPATADEEPRRDCMERCLEELPPESRDLVLQYYGEDGRSKIETRRRLAERRGLSDNALRSRVQRLRERLGRCVATCMSTKPRL
jgi:DNA-directed RNA polymerase specialized sigma24 family protein